MPEPGFGGRSGARHASTWVVVLLLLAAHLGTAFFFLLDRDPGTDAAWTGFPLDDAWIHLVYSRSIAETGTPCYNDGKLENGFTSPLWMIAGAPAHLLERWFGLDAVTGVKAIGVLFGFAASWAMVRLLLAARCGLLAAAFGGLALAFSPVMSFCAVSGMEVVLAVWLMTAALSACVRQAHLRAGILAALAVLARPEAVLLYALLSFVVVFEKRKEIVGSAAALARLALPGVVAAATWVGYSVAVTGRVLPNTFYAKYAGEGLLDPSAFLLVISEGAGRIPMAILAVLLVLVVARLLLTRRVPGGLPLLAGCVGFGLLFIYAICATRVMDEGCTAYFYWWRYLVPALTFFWIAAALGLDALFRFARTPQMPALFRIGVVCAAGAVLLFLLLPLKSMADHFAWNCQNMNEVQRELGCWVNENVPADAVVAVNDAGAIRYFGRRETLDLGGLNRHEILDERDRGDDFPLIDKGLFVELQMLLMRISELERRMGEYRARSDERNRPLYFKAGLLFDELGAVLEKKSAWLRERSVDFLVVFPMWFPDVDVASDPRWRRPLDDTPLKDLLDGRFGRVCERKSPRFTVVKAPPPGQIGQDVMRVYKVEP